MHASFLLLVVLKKFASTCPECAKTTSLFASSSWSQQQQEEVTDLDQQALLSPCGEFYMCCLRQQQVIPPLYTAEIVARKTLFRVSHSSFFLASAANAPPITLVADVAISKDVSSILLEDYYFVCWVLWIELKNPKSRTLKLVVVVCGFTTIFQLLLLHAVVVAVVVITAPAALHCLPAFFMIQLGKSPPIAPWEFTINT